MRKLNIANSKKKILIIGPIGDFGGRELETGFIAKSLSIHFDVMICSTGNLTSKSQVFDFVSQNQVTALNQIIYKKNLLIRISTLLSWKKNNQRHSALFYIKSKFNKQFLGFQKQAEKQIENLVKKSDSILICAQLSSDYISAIINYADKYKKPILFRTTGIIKQVSKNEESYLKKVTKFIHHSEINANHLNSQINLPYVIIDQCAFNENQLLNLKLREEKAVTFTSISRIVKEKNVDIVINAFLKVKEEGDKLFIVGDGIEIENLKLLALGNDEVIFTGFVPNFKLTDYLEQSDCVIISHYNEETGPLTGIEAMAAGRIIISAKTGAMPERLPNYNFWFDNNIEDLMLQIKKVKNLNDIDISQISQEIRERYQEHYSEECIANAYNKVVSDILIEI